MSGVQPPENIVPGFGSNGRSDRPLPARIADLLDDVTVGSVVVESHSGTDAGDTGASSQPHTLHDVPPQALYVAAALAMDGSDDHPPSGPAAPSSEQPADVPSLESMPAAPQLESMAEPPTVPPLVHALPPAQAISIKGRSDGLAVEIGKGAWPDILAALSERLEQSANFFRNAQVAVDLGPRTLVEHELHQLVELLKTHGMTMGAIRTNAERTFQAALALGLTATLESTEGVAMANATPAATNVTTTSYFVYRGYLRSGHRLQRKESVLVIGDVNPGAEVISGGDVFVWGRLRGVVHAGAEGNLRAIVAALDLEPTQLRIADVVTVGPDPRPGQPGKWFWSRSANKRPEVARIVNQAISMEEWDANRPGGLVSLRRGS